MEPITILCEHCGKVLEQHEDEEFPGLVLTTADFDQLDDDRPKCDCERSERDE